MTLIQPELKRLHSPDILDLGDPKIDNAKPFCFLMQAMVGVKDEDGEESFDFLVCNQKWVDLKIDEGSYSLQHHHIVERFDVTEIQSFLTSKIESIQGYNWNEVALGLTEIGRWEFANYIGHKA